MRVGSRYEQVARFLGKEVRTSFEVSALEQGQLVTISSLPGSSFPLTITRRLDPIDSGRCRVIEVAGGDPSGFSRAGDAPMRAMGGRNADRASRRRKPPAGNPLSEAL